MKGAQSFIKEYLTERTEYAIQLSGKWGVGKTHYYKTIISSIVCNTPTLQNASKKYKPVYVSVFGLKSIEDVSTKIVLEFYQSRYFEPYFKSYRIRKILRISHGVFKLGLRGFMQATKLGNLNYRLTDINNIAKNTLSEHELFLCFDDLERMESLSIENFIGYVNSLVDDGVKVLIISNEDAIDSEDYKNLKEKVVGVTIPFALPTSEVLNNIINERFVGYSVYSKFLIEKIDSLSEIANSTDNNYRHIIYALTKFQECFSEIHNNIVSINHEIKDQVESNLWLIAKTALVLAIEYKASKLKHEDETQFSENVIAFVRALPDVYSLRKTDENANESEKVVSFSFISKKYSIELSEFKFFQSIFYHLTNFEEFNIASFIEEFRQKFRIADSDILPQYKVLNALSYGECLKLNDDDYIKLTKEMIGFAEKGEYYPYEFLTVMFYSERFNNPFQLDLDDTLEKLKAGLKISIFRVNGNLHKDQFSMSLSGSASKNLKELHGYGMQTFSKAKEKSDQNELLQKQKTFLKSPDTFVVEYNESESFRVYVRTHSIFKEINIDDFVGCLTNANNVSIVSLKYFFEERFEDAKMLNDEKSTISQTLGPLYRWAEENIELKKIKSQLILEFIKSVKRFLID